MANSKESSEKMIKIEFCTQDPIRADHAYRQLKALQSKGDVVSIDSDHHDYPWPLDIDLSED